MPNDERQPAQGAQYSPREQDKLAKMNHHYRPLRTPPKPDQMAAWEPWAALALVIAIIVLLNL